MQNMRRVVGRYYRNSTNNGWTNIVSTKQNNIFRFKNQLYEVGFDYFVVTLHLHESFHSQLDFRSFEKFFLVVCRLTCARRYSAPVTIAIVTGFPPFHLITENMDFRGKVSITYPIFIVFWGIRSGNKTIEGTFIEKDGKAVRQAVLSTGYHTIAIVTGFLGFHLITENIDFRGKVSITYTIYITFWVICNWNRTDRR